MAVKQLKIYATSNTTEGSEQRPYQDRFFIGETIPPVTVLFDIPSNITNYKVKQVVYCGIAESGGDGGLDDRTYLTTYVSATGLNYRETYVSMESDYFAITVNSGIVTSRTQIITISNVVEPEGRAVTIGGPKISIEAERPYILIEYDTVDVSDLTITGTDADEDITVSWLGSCENWTLQAILNGNVVKSWTGTTATSQIITKGSLTTSGNYTFKLIAVGGDSKEITTAATLTRVEPTVIALEPDNVNQNADNNIVVSWVATNQQAYTLKLEGLSYSGTTANSLVIPAKTLKSGTKTMTLTITYTSGWGEVRTAIKTVTFLAYATPATPVLEDISIYNSATPTFRWTCSDAYTSYHFKISNSVGTEVLNTNEVVSSAKSHTSTYALANNSTYTISVRVKNQFGLWSAWDSKMITTAFVVPNKPNVNVYATNKNSIVINFNIAYSDEFEKAEIWRKSPRSEWIRIAYNLDNNFTYEDEFLGSGTHYYKVRAVGTTGGIIESDVVNESISISNFNFANCDDLTQSIEFIGDPSVKVQEIRQIVTTIYAGCAAPKPEIGEVKYRIATCSFTVEATE